MRDPHIDADRSGKARFQFNLRTLFGIQFAVAAVIAAALALHPDRIGDVICTTLFALVILGSQFCRGGVMKLVCVAVILAMPFLASLHPDTRLLPFMCVTQGLTLIWPLAVLQLFGWTFLRRQPAQRGAESPPARPLRRIPLWPLAATLLLLALLVMLCAGGPGPPSLFLLKGVYLGIVCLAVFWMVFGTSAWWVRLLAGSGAVVLAGLAAWSLAGWDDLFPMAILQATFLIGILLLPKARGFRFVRPV